MEDERAFRRGYHHAIEAVAKLYPEVKHYADEVQAWREGRGEEENPPLLSKYDLEPYTKQGKIAEALGNLAELVGIDKLADISKHFAETVKERRNAQAQLGYTPGKLQDDTWNNIVIFNDNTWLVAEHAKFYMSMGCAWVTLTLCCDPVTELECWLPSFLDMDKHLCFDAHLRDPAFKVSEIKAIVQFDS